MFFYFVAKVIFAISQNQCLNKQNLNQYKAFEAYYRT